jgi:predicted DsbA family dithiol-disulfide isomerase
MDEKLPMQFPIDVILDVVCPWCFIGKRRLDAALVELAALDPDIMPVVSWHPFELNPDLPPEGVDRRSYLEAKFGGPERARQIYERVSAAGKSVDIDFAFDKIIVQPNTLEAHRLISWAQRRGDDVSGLVEHLFEAYFLDGRDIGDRETLAAIAGEAGLVADAARRMLRSDDGVAEVRAMAQRSRELGVAGVPYVILAETVAVSGAQEVPTLLAAIGEARDDLLARSATAPAG